MFDISYLQQADPAVFSAVQDELGRQRDKIELIASENFTSRAVMAAQGSVLTNKYAEGYPGKRYYGGCEYVDVVEDIARDRAKELFGAAYANVQPHSGAQANMAAYFALLEQGDVILGMSLAHGGHLTHGAPVNFSGKQYRFESYGVEEGSEVIDYDKLMAQAMSIKPKLIVAGASAYPRKIDFAKFREIADACGALLMTDMAHIAGLVAAGVHPSPVPYADFVSTTTHKSLRGPRGGMVLCKEKWAKKLNSATFPGLQGGPLMHVIAAKAACLGEALKPEFRAYAEQVVKNSKAMAARLAALGFRIVAGGTDNHCFLVDLSGKGLNGADAQVALDKVGITVNKNAIPYDKGTTNKPSGIRIGTPAVTTRGMKEEDVIRVADYIGRCLSILAAQKVCETPDAYDALRAEVSAFNKSFPMP